MRNLITDPRANAMIQLDQNNGFDGGPPYAEINPPPSAATLRAHYRSVSRDEQLRFNGGPSAARKSSRE